MAQSVDQTTMNSSLGLARRNVENATRKVTDYNLVRIIGTGTFGKVYLALMGGKSYALKMLHKRKIIELK